MTHLTDDQLNEYLDRALDAASRRAADEHLNTCEECRQRKSELQLVFDRLAELPPAYNALDLRPAVLAGLPRSRQPVWTRAFAAQLGAAAGLLTWISVQLIPRLPQFFPSSWLSPLFPAALGRHLPTLGFRTILFGLAAAPAYWRRLLPASIMALRSLISGMDSVFNPQRFLPPGQLLLPALHLPVSGNVLIILTLLALALCALCNAALLCADDGQMK